MASWFGATHAVKEAKRQNPVLTDRNGIQGYRMRISKQIIVTSQMTKEKCPIVYTAGIGGREMRLPEEISKATRSYIEKSAEVIVGTIRYRTKGKTAGAERTG